jgi:hypothetical protein
MIASTLAKNAPTKPHASVSGTNCCCRWDGFAALAFVLLGCFSLSLA